MRRHLRLPGPPHAELGTLWEKGKRVCHWDKSGSLTLRQPNYIQICCVHIKVWGFFSPPEIMVLCKAKTGQPKQGRELILH